MGIDLNAINLKIDPGNSAQVVQQFVSGLTQAEVRGKAAGEAMLGLSGSFKSLAQAMQQEQQALGRLNVMHEQLSVKNSALVGSFNGLAQALQRERDVLDRIHGPSQKYAEDLQTLDSLFEKNAISAEQYAAQVTKLNQAIGERPEAMGEMYGPVQQQPGAGSGSLFGLGQNALAAGGGAGALGLIQQVGAAVDDLDQKFRKASDDATNFQNHALKFVESGHDTNQVLSEQKQLAHDLHAPLSQTMDLYDAIGDATSELNLSQRQLVEITKTVGEATTIANKPLASAGDIISRLAVGFEAGGDASRSVRKLIADYKDLSDVWTSAFHTSKAGLLEMVRDHKINFEQMTLALGTNTQATREAFALRHRTYADTKAELEDLASFYQQDGQIELQALASAKIEFDALDAAIEPVTAKFALLADNSKSAAQALSESNTMLKTWTAIAASFGVANQADLKVGGEYISAREHAMKELAGLQQARDEGMIKGAGAAEFYRKKWEELTTTIEGRLPAAYAIQMQLSDATLDFQRNLAGLDSLFDRHAIRLDQYTAKLHQLSDAYAGPEIRKVFEQLNMAKSPAELQAQQQSLIAADHADLAFKSGSEAPQTATQQAAERYRLELAQLNDMIERGVVDQDEANDRLAMYHAELNKGVGAIDETVRRQHDLQALVDGIKKPLQDYQYGIELTNQALHDHAINATEAAEHIKALQQAYDATQKHSSDFGAGLERGWHDIVKEATDSASQIETAMKSAFGDIQNSLADMVMKGKLDLNSLGSELESILVHLAIQQATGGLLSLIPGATSSVPHYATGGEGVIGGAGGTDSQLFMARVTPGEHFRFTPPGQDPEAMGRKGGSSSGGGGGHTIVNLNYDPKAIQSGRAIQDGVYAVIRQNPAAVRALLGL